MRTHKQKLFNPVREKSLNGANGVKKKISKFLKPIITVIISVLIIFTIITTVKAGDITPPSGTPTATFYTLSDIYKRLTENDTFTATEPSGRSFTFSDDLIGTHYTLKQIYKTIPTIDPLKLLSDITYLGVTGTMTNVGQQTITASTSNQTITAGYHDGTGYCLGDADLTVGKIKSSVDIFGVTGDYPSATYPLASADATADLAASGGNISSSNGAVEWWQSDGTRQTATLDFPTLSNVCSGDTSNNSAGTLSVTAAYLSVGNTWCGTAGTLLANLFNGTSGAFTGGSQANGGADDYNNSGSPSSGRYAMGWTACTSGADNYCGTGDPFADMKDDSTGLIWSKPCSGSGCSTSAEPAGTGYSWDNSAGNNNYLTASALCSQDLGTTHDAGWSLPHQKQLMQAYIDGSYGNLDASGVTRDYWSATTQSTSVLTAWRIYLSNGLTYYDTKSNSHYLRCVRSAP